MESDEGLKIFELSYCEKCEIRINDKNIKPYSLEYLAMESVLTKCIKERKCEKKFQVMNLPSKWTQFKFIFVFNKTSKVMKKREKSIKSKANVIDFAEWCFGVKESTFQPYKELSAHDIITKLVENRRYFTESIDINHHRNVVNFCKYCHTPRCKKCGWISTRFSKIRKMGHLSSCDSNF